MKIKRTFFFIGLLTLFAGFLWQIGLNLPKHQNIINTGDEKNNLFEGNLVWGHEVRSFIPCGESEEYWIIGSSTAMSDIKEIYQKETQDVIPARYTPLFVTVVGKIIDAPLDGFGANYEKAIEISQVVESSREGSCKNNLIILEEPFLNSDIESPLTIKGKAQGTWFFEGDFPVVLTDWDGKIIAEGYVTAQDDWMTEEFVDFEGTLEFEKPSYGERGSLILPKDNPSGLPEHDDALEITVFFK